MSNKMHHKAIVIGLVLCLAAGLSWAMSRAPKAAQQAETSQAINFTLPDINGQERTLSDYKGKAVFLLFWASWCPPCRAELPDVQKLYNESDKDKFVILAVNVGEPKAKVKDFAQKNDYTFPILIDQGAKVSLKYRAYGIPLTYVIDQQGQIVARVSGAREWRWQDFKQIIK